MSKVFGDIDRTYRGWALDNESTYSWLDRSAKPEAAAVRDRIEELYAAFPDSSGRLLRSLKHPNNRYAGAAFHGALASMVMNRRLLDLGFDVTTDEDIPGNERRPDLIAARSDVGEMVIEVTVLGSKQEFADHDWRTGILCEAINGGVKSEFYLLGIHVRGELPDAFDPAPVVDAIRARLDELGDPGDDAPSDHRLWPRLSCSVGRAEVEVEYIALSPSGREKTEDDDHKIIGIGPSGGGWPNTEGRLRKKLWAKKPQNYPSHVISGTTPYVIAVGPSDCFASSQSCRDALWGDEVILLDRESLADATLSRKPNGFFGVDPAGPRHPDVSGVLVMHRFAAEMWEPGAMTVEYFENPYALCPIEPSILGPNRCFGVVEQDGDCFRLDWHDV